MTKVRKISENTNVSERKMTNTVDFKSKLKEQLRKMSYAEAILRWIVIGVLVDVGLMDFFPDYQELLKQALGVLLVAFVITLETYQSLITFGLAILRTSTNNQFVRFYWGMIGGILVFNIGTVVALLIANDSVGVGVWKIGIGIAVANIIVVASALMRGEMTLELANRPDEEEESSTQTSGSSSEDVPQSVTPKEKESKAKPNPKIKIDHTSEFQEIKDLEVFKEHYEELIDEVRPTLLKGRFPTIAGESGILAKIDPACNPPSDKPIKKVIEYYRDNFLYPRTEYIRKPNGDIEMMTEESPENEVLLKPKKTVKRKKMGIESSVELGLFASHGGDRKGQKQNGQKVEVE